MNNTFNLRWEKDKKSDEHGYFSESAYDSNGLVYAIYYDKSHSSLILEDILDDVIYKIPDKATAYTVAFKLYKKRKPTSKNKSTTTINNQVIDISGPLDGEENTSDENEEVLITPIDELINRWKNNVSREEIDREE